MCLHWPKPLNEKEVIAFKVFYEENGRLFPLFMSQTNKSYEVGKKYKANTKLWKEHKYPAGFHALTSIDAARTLKETEQYYTGLPNMVICKVILSGELYVETCEIWQGNVSGEYMTILEKVE